MERFHVVKMSKAIKSLSLIKLVKPTIRFTSLNSLDEWSIFGIALLLCGFDQ